MNRSSLGAARAEVVRVCPVHTSIPIIIRKDSFEEIKRAGLEAFREINCADRALSRDRVHELQNWEQIKLLSVKLSRLERWHKPGLLCIGHAAHAMSPAGGVAINLAIQDAVATSNVLADALREQRVTEKLLQYVQRRHEFPTRMTQAAQANSERDGHATSRIPRSRLLGTCVQRE